MSRKFVMSVLIAVLAVGAVVMVALWRTSAENAASERAIIQLEDRLD